MLHVATPLLSVEVDAQALTPDGVETCQVTVPVGVAPAPETVAVNFNVEPRVVGEEFVTLLVGMAFTTVSLIVFEVPAACFASPL